MLYTFYGTDTDKIRLRSKALVQALQEKRPDASFFRLHHENYEHGKLTELLGSIGLFSNKYIVSVDNILTGVSERKFEDKSPAEMILEQLPQLKTSPHIWIIVEDSLFGLSSGKELGVKQSKEIEEIKKVLEKHSDKIEIHDVDNIKFSKATVSKYSPKSTEVNSFTFTDAFFEKDALRAIAALHQLFAEDIAAEEIHGALWWQTKVLMQIQRKSTKSLTPFMLQKANRFMKNWNDDQLISLTNLIISSYHQAHLGKTELKDQMMKMTLEFAKK